MAPSNSEFNQDNWFIPAAEFVVPPDEDRWLVDTLIGAQSVAVLGGAPKLGKSWVASHIAVAVATGEPCLEQFAVHEPGPVLIVSAEGPPWMPTDRLSRICGHLDMALDDVAIRVMSQRLPRLDDPNDQDRLLREVDENKARLLILDPLIQLHSGDENSSRGLAPVLNYLDRLRRETGACVLLVHHVRKGARGSGGAQLRGSSALHGWLDSGLYLTPQGDDAVMRSEQRCGPAQDPIGLRLVTETEHHHLEVIDVIDDDGVTHSREDADMLKEQILDLLDDPDMAFPRTHLRASMGVKNSRLSAPLRELEAEGLIERTSRGIRRIEDDDE